MLVWEISEIPYEVYFATADEPNAGTDCHVSVQLFGTDGASNEVTVEKLSDRFERGQTSVVKVLLSQLWMKQIRLVRQPFDSSHDNRHIFAYTYRVESKKLGHEFAALIPNLLRNFFEMIRRWVDHIRLYLMLGSLFRSS